MEQEKFVYQFVEEDYSDYNNDDIKYIETDKECSHLIEFCMDIWDNREDEDYLRGFIEYNKEDGEIVIDEEIYQMPETFSDLMEFIFGYLESRGVNASYYCPKIDGTFRV